MNKKREKKDIQPQARRRLSASLRLIESSKKMFRYTKRFFATTPYTAIHYTKRYFGKRYNPLIELIKLIEFTVLQTI